MAFSARCCAALLLGVLLCAGVVFARPRRHRTSTPGEFSYYVLALSYAPDFCDQPVGNKDPRECGAGRHAGFVVHGFWPQGESSRGPEYCGPASPVSSAIVQAMLRYIPTPSLIQHEWAAHGTCSGLETADYFASLRKARDSIRIPAAFRQPAQTQRLAPEEIESGFAVANPGFPKAAFRSSCYRNGELEEIRVCVTKGLTPRACGASVQECPSPVVTLLPVR